MEFQHFSHNHMLLLKKENDLDPDKAISSICFICNLPIFSTPYYNCNAHCNNFFIHERCAHLPQQIKHIEKWDLHAEIVSNNEFDHQHLSCNICHRKCVNVAWRTKSTPIMSSSLSSVDSFAMKLPQNIRTFDAFCVAPLDLRIIHESHKHELIPMVVGEEFSVSCVACGLKHEDHVNEPGRSNSSICYWCYWCRFWIHENCATLPHYIEHEQHADHILALTYALHRKDQGYSYRCEICGVVITSLGIYLCGGPCHYYIHVKCATNRSVLYKSVPSGEFSTQGSIWIQFPMEDEDTSLVTHVLWNITDGSSSSAAANEVHEHPLSLNEKFTGVIQGRRALCNGCVQPISPPYYSCSQCTDYLLHEYCANLPLSFATTRHIHPLILLTNYDNFGFHCSGCGFRCNGFSYCCKTCNFQLDVPCTFFPRSIIHKAHHERHVLRRIHELNHPKSLEADCCGADRIGRYQYMCTNCDFLIHSFCAGLPLSVRHKFDKHPLKLITMGPLNYWEECDSSNVIATTEQDEDICEFCEEKIERKHWYYGCAECNHSFHVECISTVGKTSKIKLQASLNIPCHPHPLTGIRLLTDLSRNSRCGYCQKKIKNFEDELAFECLDCDFTIHYDCARRDSGAESETG